MWWRSHLPLHKKVNESKKINFLGKNQTDIQKPQTPWFFLIWKRALLSAEMVHTKKCMMKLEVSLKSSISNANEISFPSYFISRTHVSPQFQKKIRFTDHKKWNRNLNKTSPHSGILRIRQLFWQKKKSELMNVVLSECNFRVHSKPHFIWLKSSFWHKSTDWICRLFFKSTYSHSGGGPKRDASPA